MTSSPLLATTMSAGVQSSCHGATASSDQDEDDAGITIMCKALSLLPRPVSQCLDIFRDVQQRFSLRTKRHIYPLFCVKVCFILSKIFAPNSVLPKQATKEKGRYSFCVFGSGRNRRCVMISKFWVIQETFTRLRFHLRWKSGFYLAGALRGAKKKKIPQFEIFIARSAVNCARLLYSIFN